MKKRLTTWLLIAVLIAGLCIMLYPLASDYWNGMIQSRAIVDYETALSNLTHKDYTAAFETADAYNAALRGLDFPLTDYDRLDGRADIPRYEDILNVNGNGIMGYISIPKIGVELPIYHGTETDVLDVAAGHLEGTSLPVGGESTHCVLSAHRGLPSAKLFTDLDEMEMGDSFTITVLDRVLTYEVDQIKIVEPNELNDLYVIEGEDHCTLVTCTPYGINTHRLLVRGKRIETGAAKAAVYARADAVLIDGWIVAAVLAMPMLPVLLALLLIRSRGKAEEREGKRR